MNQYTSALLFFVGLVAQSVLLVGRPAKGDARRYGSALLVSAGMGVYGFLTEPSVAGGLYYVVFGYIFFYALYFRSRLLRYISPEVIIYWSMLLGYLSYERHNSLLVALSAASIIVGVVSLVAKNIDRRREVVFVLYVQYLALVSGVSYLGISLARHSAQLLFNDANSLSLNPITALVSGMALTGLAVNATYLYSLIPGRTNSIGDIMIFARQLGDHFNPDAKKSIYPVSALVFVAVVLVANSINRFVGDTTLLSILISLSALLSARTPRAIADPSGRYRKTS